jgi:hypothetical protein
MATRGSTATVVENGVAADPDIGTRISAGSPWLDRPGWITLAGSHLETSPTARFMCAAPLDWGKSYIGHSLDERVHSVKYFVLQADT